MPIPNRTTLRRIILQSMQVGKLYTSKDLQTAVKNEIHLTDDELNDKYPSGTRKWINEVYDSLNKLKDMGYVLAPQRNSYQITEAGKNYLSNNTDNEPFTVNEPEAPSNAFDQMYLKINDTLADELRTAILARSSDFFERLVVQLMESMGYGGYDGAGLVTPTSRDGGIDGIIFEDKLGFNRIYIQAKRWEIDKVIGKPEIQKFVGALAGPPKIEKGLFITTARFSEEARKYAKDQRIILVDGKKLTELMIEFDVGVSTQKIYRLKKVDGDFFSD